VRYSLDPEILAAQTDVETYTGGGPGGQHRNKSQTAVRLHHRPSGIIVTATERRSQLANKKVAFERLHRRLVELNRPVVARVATRPTRSSKRKRLEQKSHDSRKKRDRRGFDD